MLIFKVVYRKKFLRYDNEKNFLFAASLVLHVKTFWERYDKN